MGNKSYYNDSQFPTEKKDFESNLNPHFLKRNFQKRDCVWLGTYNNWVSSDQIAKALKGFEEDPTLPVESAAIHLKDYDIVFQKNGEDATPIMVKNEESGVALIKIYLIKRNQLEYLINLETKSDFKGKN